MAETNTRQTSRAPVTLKIKFKSETLDQFIERYSVDISHGGIFIRTKDPLAVGTALKFEFQLKDATPLIGGEGTVVWTREHDPKRSGVSPGMGVRFDKLPSESQKVLDEVLARKNGSSDVEEEEEEEEEEEDLGGDFVDTPTRVAPAALVDSLTNDYHEDMTPLPKPMPFHGDMDDFSDEAFSESTKVASLDTILAQAKSAEEASDYDEDQVFASTARTPAISPPAEKPQASADAYEDPFADLNEDADALEEGALEEDALEEDASDRAATIAVEEGPASTVAASTVAASTVAASTVAASTVAASDDDAPSADASQHSDLNAAVVAPEVGTTTARMSVVADTPDSPKAAVATAAAEADRGSSMPWIAVAAVILLIGGVGGFWLLNKDKDKDKDDGEESQAAAALAPADAGKLDEKAINDPIKDVKPKVLVVPTVSVAVSTVPEGATIAVEGTDISATSPATLDLPEGKNAVLLITHPEFLPQSMEVLADGAAVGPFTLVAMPRVLRFTSTPAGAKVFVNGQKLPGLTPLDVPFNARFAKRTKLNIQYRLPRHKMWSTTVPSEGEFAAEDGSLIRTLDASLAPMSARPGTRPQTKPDTSKPEPSSGEPDAPKADPPKDETPKDETSTDPPKDEVPSAAPTRDVTPKDETPKDETPKADGELTPDWMK